MKKLVILSLTLISLMLTACGGESKIEYLAQIEEGSVDSIQITMPMNNPEYGAERKIITDQEEISEFVAMFNSGVIGKEIDDEDVSVGAVSEYVFILDDGQTHVFSFNIMDTNIVYLEDGFKEVVYGDGDTNPLDLYNASQAQELLVDAHGNVIEIDYLDKLFITEVLEEGVLDSFPSYSEYNEEIPYSSNILFNTTTTLEDVEVVRGSIVFLNNDTFVFNIEESLLLVDEFSQEKPILVPIAFESHFNSTGLLFKDNTGNERLFIVIQSGMDGSFHLAEEENFTPKNSVEVK